MSSAAQDGEQDANLETARRFYQAFQTPDAHALLDSLAPDFRGTVARGMPLGVGGTYEGPEQILGECWGRVYQVLDTRPVPEEYLQLAEADRMVVLGRYLGTARESGRTHDAAFAHVLRFRDGRISELTQITDTSCWHEALAPSA